jgi:hypothetical protein
MWFVLKLLGVEVLALGIGTAGKSVDEGCISNTGGQFELAPVEEELEEEWEDDEEYRFGFRS